MTAQPQDSDDPDTSSDFPVVERVALVNESSIASTHIAGVYARQWISASGKAVFQRFKIDICLQRSKLAERVDIFIVEVPVRGSRKLILEHVAVAALPVAQSR
jgi:hypothetical protein